MSRREKSQGPRDQGLGTRDAQDSRDGSASLGITTAYGELSATLPMNCFRPRKRWEKPLLRKQCLILPEDCHWPPSAVLFLDGGRKEKQIFTRALAWKRSAGAWVGGISETGTPDLLASHGCGDPAPQP